MSHKKTNENSVGAQMKKIRKDRGLTQQDVCNRWPGNSVYANGETRYVVCRTTYTKYENGTLLPNPQRIEEFASIFNISPDELYKKSAVVIPDINVLLSNNNILEWLMEDFDQIIISGIVQLELEILKNQDFDPVKYSEEELPWRQKQHRMTKRKATNILLKIQRIFASETSEMNDNKERKRRLEVERISNPRVDITQKALKTAELLNVYYRTKKNSSQLVYLLYQDDDTQYTTNEDVMSLSLDEYTSSRLKTLDGYDIICSFDETFDNIERFDKMFEYLSPDMINAYLPNGLTLLISCITCNDPDRLEKRGNRIISETKIINKVRFLINHNADVNKSDCGSYYHPPLLHCIPQGFNSRSEYYFELFKILLDAKADYNKCSLDETKNTIQRRISVNNEGNTALMRACWEGRKEFVQELLKYQDLSLNQQDCNGYTALIKCAVQRYNKKKDRVDCSCYEDLFHLLIDSGADPRIRDRNNKTAQDWWNMGDSLDEEEPQ